MSNTSLKLLALIGMCLPINAYAQSPSNNTMAQLENTVVNADDDKNKLSSIPVNDADENKNFPIQNSEVKKMVDSLKFCAESTNPKIRLGCYENLTKQQGVQVSLADNEGEVKPEAQWFKQHDDKTYISMLPSGTAFRQNNMDNTVSVKFYVRCEKGNLSTYFNVGNSIGRNDLDVDIIPGTSINGGLSTTYKMTPSSTGTAFGVWNDAQARVLAHYILSGKLDGFVMVAHLNSDEGESKITAKFNLKTVLEGTVETKEACSL